MKAGQIASTVWATPTASPARKARISSPTRCSPTSTKAPADVPSFFFYLGDVVYYFGEATYYYDQFYEPYRDLSAPIVAIAGNHDGNRLPRRDGASLDAFVANFCTRTPRTAQTRAA